METGRYKYKCRGCGKEYLNDAVSSYSNMQINLISLTCFGEPARIGFGNPLGLMDIHHCHEKEKGVADLISLIKIDEP